MKKKLLAGVMAASVLFSGSTAAGMGTVQAAENGGEKEYSGVTLTLMTTNENVLDGLNAVIAAAEEKYGFEIELDITGSGGEDYNNLVKTRLASGDMDDLLLYNSGALFKQLNPAQYFVDISSDKELMERLDETFVETVSADGATYGVPFSSSQAGCILWIKTKS